MEIGSQKLTNTIDIANAFNFYFANIGSNLAKGPFIIYTLGGGGDSYVIYKNHVALPPLDDLNVEDPPIKY